MNREPVNTVVVYASNLTGAGAQNIGTSLLPILIEKMQDYFFILLLPETEAFRSILVPSNAILFYRQTQHGFRNDILRIKDLLWQASNQINDAKADICLTLGDLMPQNLNCPNVLFFQQALLIYKESELKRRNSWNWFKRILLKGYFASTVKKNTQIIVQTPVMAKRLSNRYKVLPDQVSIISQPVPQDIAFKFADAKPLPEILLYKKPIKLLFLASYYPHKNHQILLGVIEELKRRQVSEQVHFFLTVENSNELPKNTAKIFLAYPEMITNLGRLSTLKVAQAYRSSTALFMPTLAESYGLIYLEAMLFGTPILTSDRDFAHWICGKTAIYFDPLNPTSIADAIMKVPKIDISSYQKYAVENLQRFPKNWAMVADQFAEVLRKLLCFST